MASSTSTSTGPRGKTRHTNDTANTANLDGKTEEEKDKIIAFAKGFWRTTVNGQKDVQEYITQVTGLATKIRANFMNEMADSASSCNQRCRESSHDFAMEMCGVTHRAKIYNETELPQFSVFLQTERVLLACLAQLEALRKMLVNNKQQKKTAVRRLRELRNCLQTHNATMVVLKPLKPLKKQSILQERREREECQEHAKIMELGTGLDMDLEKDQSNPTIKHVQRMIESTKQDHRTISKGLIHQATNIMDAIRTRHILDLAKAADDTAGAIMEHAKKCQAFMTQCLRLSAIEYCAKIWWFGTQNPDPTNSKNYYIHAEVVHDYGDAVEGETPNPCDYHFKASRSAEYFAFCAENRPAPRICITVYGDPDPEGGNNSNPIICKYDFDQEFAETILTDEAIDQFEEARRA